MADWEKTEEPVTLEPKNNRKRLYWILAGLLGVLIVVNIVLLIFYFVLDDSGEKGGTSQKLPSASAEESELPDESESDAEEVSSSSEPDSQAETPAPTSSAPVESVPASSSYTSPTTGNTTEEFGVVFDLVEEEQVTAKIFVNLRTYPGVRSDDDIAATLSHGEWATRVAIGRNGWCKLEYNGQTLYAVNSYLTTDANWTQGAAVSTDIEEFGVIFHETADTVTAKEKTNLRTQPTTDSEIVLELSNGETVSRNGYSDTGWSRLSWNGQTVYAVTNYLEIVN